MLPRWLASHEVNPSHDMALQLSIPHCCDAIPLLAITCSQQNLWHNVAVRHATPGACQPTPDHDVLHLALVSSEALAQTPLAEARVEQPLHSWEAKTHPGKFRCRAHARAMCAQDELQLQRMPTLLELTKTCSSAVGTCFLEEPAAPAHAQAPRL